MPATVDRPPGAPDPAVDRALLGFVTELLVFVDVDGRVLLGAGDGLAALGDTAAVPPGVPLESLVHPDDRPAVTALVERLGRQPLDVRQTLRLRIRRGDGGWQPLDVTVFTVVDAVLGPGAVLRLHEVADVSPAARAEADEQRFLSLAESLPTGILDVDAGGHVRYANRAAERILGRVPAGLDEWLEQVHEDDRPELREAVALVRSAAVHEEATFRVLDGDVVRWVHARIIRSDDDGHADGDDGTLLLVVEDVTDLHRASAALARQATHDPLTGLPNRTLFTDRLEQVAARRGLETDGIAVLFLDLDGFKPVNDTFGHQAGDELLKAVAHRIRSQLRPNDTVARFGGDEFVVLATGLDQDGAGVLARRIQAEVAEPVAFGGHLLRVTTTIGVAVATTPTTAERLLAEADVDMYRRKRR